MSIIKDFIVKAGVQIQGTSSTVSTLTGALQVGGGAGIAGAVYAGGIATIGAIPSLQGTGSTSSSNVQTLRVTGGGIGVVGDSYINGKTTHGGQTWIADSTPTSSTGTGALIVQGGLGVWGGAYFANQVFVQGSGIITTATLGLFGVSAVFAGTDTAVSSNTGTVTVWNTSNLQSITNRGASTNNAISITNATSSTNFSNGALVVGGGVGVWQNLNVAGDTAITGRLTVTNSATIVSTLDATSITQGALTVSGGLAVAKNIYSLQSVITSANASVSTVGSNALAVTAGGLGVAGTAYIVGNTVLASTTNGTSTSTGQALLVAGGVGVAGNVAAGKIITTDATAATTGGAGSVQVAGGAYVAGNVVVKSTASSSVSTASNALYVAGSVGIDNNLYVGGEIIAQKLTIQYTTVTTTIVQTDDVIYTYNNQNATSTATGALQVPYGGVGIGRDLWVGGNGKVAGNFDITGNLSFGSGTTASGSFGIFYGDVYGSNAIYGGVTGYTPLPATTLQLTANTSTYAQTNFQNINSGTRASADIVITADNGTDGTRFLDLGMASSNYAYPGYEIIGPNDGYLNVSGGDLTFYTATANHNIKFYTGGSATSANSLTNVANMKLELIDSAGVNIPVSINATTTASAALTVAGGIGIGRDLRVGGTIFGNVSGTVTTATNLAGGAAGSIPIQSAGGTTAYIPLGANGYILTAGANTATWSNASSLVIGTANQAQNVSVTGTNVNASFFPTLSSAVYPAGVYTQLWSTSSFSINGNTGVVTFAAAVDSNSSASGTLIVTGGAGIGKALTVGSTLTNFGPHLINNSTQASNTNTGALIVQGGAGIWGNLYAGQLYDSTNRVVTSVTPTAGTGIAISATTTGPAATFTVVNHGVQTLTGSTYIGVDKSTGTVTLTNLGVQTLTAGTDTVLTLSGANTGTVSVWSNSTLQSVTQRGASTIYGIAVNSSTNATSTGTGGIVTTGGVGISRDVWIGGTLVRSGNVSANGWLANGIGFTSPAASYNDATLTGAQSTATVHSLGVPTLTASATPTYSDAATLYINGAPVAGSGVTITNPWAMFVSSGNVKIGAGTISNATNNGALVVVGGIGVGGNATVGGTVTAGTAATGTPVSGFASNNLLVASYTSSSLGAASTSTTQNLDVWSTSTYRSARYSVQLVDTGFTPHRIHFTEIVLIHDGAANVYKSEYGVITNIGELGTFDANVTGSGVQLTFQPAWPSLTPPSALVVKAVRTTIS